MGFKRITLQMPPDPEKLMLNTAHFNLLSLRWPDQFRWRFVFEL